MPVQISPSSSDSLQESKARERQKAHRSFLHLQHFVEHLVDERMRVLRDRHLGAFSEAPPGTNTTGPAYAAASGSNANFDTSMVIILAALLCALIFALGLNSIVRCALRCGRRLAFETPEEEATRLAATGLKRQALRRIPVAVYGEGADIPPATECPICLGEFADGENVRVLPKCHHGFHVRCIDKWLASHSSCPTCRRSLLEQGAGEGAEAIGQAVSRSGGGAGELALA